MHLKFCSVKAFIENICNLVQIGGIVMFNKLLLCKFFCIEKKYIFLFVYAVNYI